jgi:CO/xanthine dehydrogenase FAD-binding subunit
MFDVDYIRPQDLGEALDFIKAYGPDTIILAGGTDVMVDMRSGDLNRKYLLDVGRLAELRQIKINEGKLTIGAAITIAEIGKSDIIGRNAPSLQIAADKFASRQVRNIATIGGNVAHCSPCGDTIPPLLIHDAVAVVVSPAGQRNLPIEEMAGGPYHCTLRPNELITHFILKPKPENVEFADFQKIGRRKELAIARMSMAAMVAQENDKSISLIRFALGSCTPTPHRFRNIENYLSGKIPDETSLWEAGQILAEGMLEITGRRASAIYKEPAIQGLFMRMMHPLTL